MGCLIAETQPATRGVVGCKKPAQRGCLVAAKRTKKRPCLNAFFIHLKNMYAVFFQPQKGYIAADFTTAGGAFVCLFASPKWGAFSVFICCKSALNGAFFAAENQHVYWCLACCFYAIYVAVFCAFYEVFDASVVAFHDPGIHVFVCWLSAPIGCVWFCV